MRTGSRLLVPTMLALMLAACGGSSPGPVAKAPDLGGIDGGQDDGGSPGGGAGNGTGTGAGNGTGNGTGNGNDTGGTNPGTPPANNKSLAIAVDQQDDPLLASLVPSADADTKGMWRAPADWPLVAIHAALLPNGKLATFGTPLASTTLQAARLFDIWDPMGGKGPADHTTLLNAANIDSFCSSGTWLSSGKLLVSGGNSTFDSVVLDVEAQSTSTTPKFSSERWYSTVLTLADGRPIVLGGGDFYVGNAFENPDWYDDGSPTDVNDGVAMTPEIYNEGSGWSLLGGATSREAFGPDHNRYFYPRAWVARDGKVFGLSSDKYWRLDPTANGGQGSIEILGTFHGGISETTLPNIGPVSSAVMFAEGKILQTGGNGYTNGANSAEDVAYIHRTTSSRRATVFDLGNGSVPTITEVASMHHARQWHNVTVLPDGHVLATGGTRYANYAGAQAVMAAEQWNPQQNTWTELASASRVRVYHSSAVLLPSGIVFSGGGGVPGPVTNLDAEFFLPPYLFTRDNGSVRLATRPKVLSVSSRQLTHGAKLEMQMDTDEPVAEVVLLGLSNVTHSNNASQRRLNAVFSQDDFMLEVEMPQSGSMSPPGYYMVVVLDARGVPSRGVIVGLGFS
ncbi:MAG: DUF1929 domain-containing protein [Burkholderiaceae bacterium]